MNHEDKNISIDLYGDGIGKVQYIDHMGTDLTIVNSARVSFGVEKEERGNTNGRRIRKNNTYAVPRKEKKIDLPVVVDTKWTEMKDTLQEQTGVDLTKLDTTHSEMTLYGTSSAYFLVLRPYAEMNKAIAQRMKDETI